MKLDQVYYNLFEAYFLRAPKRYFNELNYFCAHLGITGINNETVDERTYRHCATNMA